jgi:hypothetical protein
MNARTRYLVIASLLVLAVGLGTGLVAYYVGLPALQRHPGPAELEFVPRAAAIVAYADVREVMRSELRQRLRRAMPAQENGRREFEDATGVNVETDIDRVVACWDPQDAGSGPSSGLVFARGVFNEAKIEALMRDHGARVDAYKNKRIVVGESGPRHESLALAFIEPGLVAIGNERLLHAVIDLPKGGDNATNNVDMMRLIRAIDGANAWAVGRFDALQSTATLPPAIAQHVPAITWFSISARVTDGLDGVVRAEARDGDAAKDLREVVRGFVALAKLQAGANPQLQSVIQSLDIGGDDKTVALTFSVPGGAIDTLGAIVQPHNTPQPAH